MGFILCGFRPFSAYLNIANVALIGATILFMTKTISFEKTLHELNWGVLLTVGAITTLGTGLEKTGAGELIASSILDFSEVKMLP